MAAPSNRVRGPRSRAIALTAEHLKTTATHTPPPDAETRLYFDGGSRGNPGNAGSGSVLLTRRTPDDQWTIIWWDAHYLGPTATNNMAEHTGLARGLEAYSRRTASTESKLLIVGDSQLILAHLTGSAHCTEPTLEDIVQRSHDALNQVPHYKIRHTLRAGNTIADWLANIAMDTAMTRTSTTAWTHIDTTLTRMLPTITDTYFTRPNTTPQIIPEIDQILDNSRPAGQRRKRTV